VAQLSCGVCSGAVSATEVVCHTCGTILVGDGATVVSESAASESIPTPTPAPAGPRCPDCGEPVEAGATMCSSCMKTVAPAGAYATRREEPAGGRLLLRIGSADVTVPRGQSLPLGRDAHRSPAAGPLAPYDNVSRLHATIGMDADGRAWIRDERSTNGTYVDGRKLSPGETTPLTAASALRLAADVPIEVRMDEGAGR
jgi:FHA domain-containing protein/double zinc ribbon protein